MIKALSKGVISEKAFIGLYFMNHRGELKKIKDFEVRNNRHALFKVNGVYYLDFELDFYKKKNKAYVLIRVEGE